MDEWIKFRSGVSKTLLIVLLRTFSFHSPYQSFTHSSPGLHVA